MANAMTMQGPAGAKPKKFITWKRAMVYGVLMLIGALSGRSDPLQPLAGIGAPAGPATGGVQVTMCDPPLCTADTMTGALGVAHTVAVGVHATEVALS